MTPLVKHFFDPNTSTFTYIVYDQHRKIGAIIDPVLDFDSVSGEIHYHCAEQVLTFIHQEALTIEWILETHAHADHLTSAQYLKKALNAKVAIGSGILSVQKTFKDVFNFPETFATDGSQFDICFNDNDKFTLGDVDVKVISTPGHTNDSLTYLIGDAAFIGDTMFHPEVGTARCDFPGGDASMLYQSIQKILNLPEETRIFLCHDYPDNGREAICQVSIAEQRAANIHIKDENSETDFITFRKNRDKELSMPKLLYPAVQVNIAAGNFPEAENNQQIYLKIPVKIQQEKGVR
jgi:glyoxylase-like metal-dependent hydrolase (beta-lactamase superfamily II)